MLSFLVVSPPHAQERGGPTALGIGNAGISRRVLLLIPHTDGTASIPPRTTERPCVLAAWLLAQQRHEVVCKRPGKRRNALGLELHAPRTSKSVSLLGSKDCGSAENLSACRCPEAMSSKGSLIS